jgi:hypothetical protein
MRLIEISALHGKLSPLDFTNGAFRLHGILTNGCRLLNQRPCALKSQQAAKQLGRKANLNSEQLDEVPLRKFDVRGRLPNGHIYSHRPKQAQGSRYRGVPPHAAV